MQRGTFDEYGSQIIDRLLQEVERVINRSEPESIDKQGITLATICSVFKAMTVAKVRGFVDKTMPALMMIRLKIHRDDEDPRYPYLYDAWSSLLQIIPPIKDSEASQVFALVIEGFSYINKFMTEKATDTDKVSGSIVANYSRMNKAMKLLTSLSKFF